MLAWYIYFILIGLFLGSFTNVLIYRIPEKRSIIFPNSFCPACDRPIKFYDNIPVLSYIFLGGRCRSCKEKISPLYPAIELLTAAITVTAFAVLGFSPGFFVFLAAIPVLISIAVIDIKTMYIYDGELIFLSVVLFIDLLRRFLMERKIPLDNILSGISLLVFFGAVFFIAKLIYRKEAFGSGDVLLAALLAAFLGMRSIFVFVLIATSTGALTGLAVLALKKKRYVPFGPFIILSFLVIFIFEDILKRVIPGFFLIIN